MADLTATIGADLTELKAGLAQGVQSINRFGSDATQASNAAGQAFNSMGGQAMSASNRMMQMRSGLSAARDGMLAFAVGGQRADMMLMAMGHHINTLYESTGTIGGAFKSLGNSLMGPGGVILGITVLYELFKHLGGAEDDAYDATKHFEGAAGTLHTVFNNLDGSFVKAVENLDELKINVGLAKDGLLKKSEVVKEYNDTMGKTTGTVKTLAEVEDKLVNAGPAYIKMMLYKAAAQTALKEAADKALEGAKASKKSDDESLGFFDRVSNIINRTGGSGGAGGKGTDNTQQAEAEKRRMASENRNKEIAAYKKDSDLALTVAQEFQKKAADISKEMHFSFFGGDEDPDKAAKAKTLLQTYEIELKKLQDQQAHFIEQGGVADFFNPTPLERNINAMITKIDELKEKLKGAKTPEFGQIDKADANGKIAGESASMKMDYLQSADPKNFDGIVSSMKAGVKSLGDWNDAMYASGQASKRFKLDTKEEQMAVRELANTIGGGLANAFQNAMQGTQSFMSSLGQFITQLIEKLLAAAAAAAILAGLLALTGFTEITSAVGGFSGLFGSISGLSGAVGAAGGNVSSGSIPGHADGGITTRPHLAMVGEGREKEAIMPLSKLQNFVSSNQGGGVIMTKVQGPDLLIWLDRAQKQKGRT